MTEESNAVDFSSWSCPIPLRDYPRIVMGHGGGGKLSNELIEHLFLPAFGNASQANGHDSAVFTAPASLAAGGRLAFSTDSYVVHPLFFPGGNIGDLAVNGTVNDLAMSGAQPLALSVGMIIEEGLELETLGLIAESMGAAATTAGVSIATGDTKVVERGSADGLFINTAGVGVVPNGIDIHPTRARPGDAVIVSGSIGVHGLAIMSLREGLEFGTTLETDSQPLNGVVAELVEALAHDIHVLRDPTRGGLAASLCEIASTASVGVEFIEASVPVPAEVQAACGFLGLDPLSVANEGTFVAIVDAARADEALEILQRHPAGHNSVRIGTIVDDHPGTVVARTGLGARRIVDIPLGEQLPRIC